MKIIKFLLNHIKSLSPETVEEVDALLAELEKEEAERAEQAHL